MKKIYIAFLLMVLFITGCSNDKLTCGKKSKEAGYDYSETYEFTYDKNGSNLSKVGLKIKSIYNEYYTDEEIDKEYNEILNYCELYELESDKKITCSAELKDRIITADIIIKVEDIDDEVFELMMYVTKEEINNRKNTKKMLENVGYSCK